MQFNWAALARTSWALSPPPLRSRTGGGQVMDGQAGPRAALTCWSARSQDMNAGLCPYWAGRLLWDLFIPAPRTHSYGCFLSDMLVLPVPWPRRPCPPPS